ncbi:EamA family transporter [Sphingomonas sp. MG17]|uniref:EamA family transporter n=1 Tax=Sphingomonas tagetis TaxID=2949092 RepID=A0A9X2HIW6_9SPHN|nr:EamA family transporter [Sphingomonas tagetis]MCP3729944.1 EamA family transporter [Sphingomonas tagetis]
MTHASRDARNSVATGVAALLSSLAVQNVGAAFAKLIFPLIGAFGVTAVRITLSALLLGALLRPWRRAVPRDMLPALIGYGAMLGLMNLLIYQAFARIPIGVAAGVEILGPLGVALAGSRRAIDRLWLAVAVVGLLLLVPLRAQSGLDPIGLLFAVGAAACWAMYILLGTRVSHGLGGDAVAWGMAVATILTLPFGLASAGTAMFAPNILLVGLAVACLSSALPYSLEMKAMRHLQPHVVGLLFSLYPVTGALAGFAILGERLSVTQWAAIACIVAASAGCAATAAKAEQR